MAVIGCEIGEAKVLRKHVSKVWCKWKKLGLGWKRIYNNS
jgi:hypothetical protein